MTIFFLMLFIFVLGYAAIALEHPLHVNKAATALLTGMTLWAVYALFSSNVLELGFSPTWADFSAGGTHGEDAHKFQLHFLKHDLSHHLVEVAEILFFLLGAMTIVETVDRYQGFKIITDMIKTTNKVKLLWILSILTFFMSAALDNLTTTIVLVALLRKLIEDKKDRWFFVSMVVLAANAGGAWSPIGDVTTIMLWVKGNVTTIPIITTVILPSLVTVLVPLAIVSFTLKGNVTTPKSKDNEVDITTQGERIFLLVFGISALLFVPIFKTITHLPPYIGMLFGLGSIWLVTEIILRRKKGANQDKLSVIKILEHVDVPTIFFFMGILLAVAALQSAGHLDLLAGWLDSTTDGNIYVIDMSIGVLSAIVDNVPLVAGSMGMYDFTTYTPEQLEGIRIALEAVQGIEPAMIIQTLEETLKTSTYSPEITEGISEALVAVQTNTSELSSLSKISSLLTFNQDGTFWSFLAYTAGTGGSILIIGSAAGVAAMGMEKIDFIWYFKKISYLAAIGYFAGAGAYILQDMIIN